jgi:dTDP-4-dehydrorhamnose 3,5-epimerase
MTFLTTKLPGCFEVRFTAHCDDRGLLVKTTQVSAFREFGLETGFAETLYSVSGENVLRGMHLQLAPAQQAKLIYCVSGSVMDVALDLRPDSEACGTFAVIELSGSTHNAAYLPAGVAHGFYVRSAPAILCYHITSEHAPGCDAGVAWDSFGAPWPTSTPLVSRRDSDLPPLTEFLTVPMLGHNSY